MDDALKAFSALKETPEFFRWYIERYLMYQQQGAAQALEHTLVRLSDDAGHARVWRELGRADGAVLLLAARDVQDLYSAQALAQLQVLPGTPDVTASTPRTSIRRLTGVKLQLVARVGHGAYRIEEPEFQSWVAARPTVD